MLSTVLLQNSTTDLPDGDLLHDAVGRCRQFHGGRLPVTSRCSCPRCGRRSLLTPGSGDVTRCYFTILRPRCSRLPRHRRADDHPRGVTGGRRVRHGGRRLRTERVRCYPGSRGDRTHGRRVPHRGRRARRHHGGTVCDHRSRSAVRHGSIRAPLSVTLSIDPSSYVLVYCCLIYVC